MGFGHKKGKNIISIGKAPKFISSLSLHGRSGSELVDPSQMPTSL